VLCETLNRKKEQESFNHQLTTNKGGRHEQQNFSANLTTGKSPEPIGSV
jgi:hypothetical protein